MLHHRIVILSKILRRWEIATGEPILMYWLLKR